jgi:hypothetical protein
MEPRLLLRTHYQVDEPAFVKLLLQRCTSAVRGDYPERVASRLADELKRAGREFNPAAGKYAVDLARGLALLTTNLIWTELGHLMNLVCDPSGDSFHPELSLRERLLFFRLYLGGDGGALVFLARALREHGELPPTDQNWNTLANSMVLEVYTEYLDLIANPATRVRMRHVLEKRRAHPFAGKSGAHQMFVHLQTLCRLGLLTRVNEASSRRYRLAPGSSTSGSALQTFLTQVPDVRTLERILKENEWVVLAQRVFEEQLPPLQSRRPRSSEGLIGALKPLYDQVSSTGLTVCPIQPLIEAVQIGQLVNGETAVLYGEAMSLLQEFQRLHPRQIRFHVDRVGRPAFLKISSDVDV